MNIDNIDKRPHFTYRRRHYVYTVKFHNRRGEVCARWQGKATSRRSAKYQASAELGLDGRKYGGKVEIIRGAPLGLRKVF